MESQLCGDEELIIVGGANSAGQAAVFLAQTARKVHMLVRAKGLSDTMSRYLIQRITENPGIELHYQTEIVALEGDGNLERVTWRDATGRTSTHPIRHVFIMTGASPRTDWLNGCVVLDEKGFILTGKDLNVVPNNNGRAAAWSLVRPPEMLETNLPGVFAAGDIRAGSVKRVASAVGEGAMAVQFVHKALAS
jgi:thioredoxin reductase (NADPH)